MLGGLPANVKLTVAPLATTWRKKFPTAAPMAPPASPVKFSTGRALKKGTPSGAKKFPGLKLHPIVSINPELIGGVCIRVGDKLLDGSIRARLAQMKTTLTA